MRFFRFVLIGAVVLAAAGVPARASTIRQITVSGVSFTPSVVHAVGGDLLRWTVQDGTHTITAYNGGVFNNSLANPGTVYDFTFAGGTALYRCEFHSGLNALTLVCEGMCAAITDRTTAPGSTAILTPTDGADIPTGTFRMEGTADPQTTAIIAEGGVERARAVANASGIWRVDATFAQGVHSVIAHAVDVDGRAGPDSAPVAFRITADTTPPTAAIGNRDPAVFVIGPAQIRGTAADDTAVAYIEVEIFPLLLSEPRIVQADLCTGCGGKAVTWALRRDIPRGVLWVRARAVDFAGNLGEWTPSIKVINTSIRGS